MQLLCENRCALSQIKIGNFLVSVTFCRFYQFSCFCGLFFKIAPRPLDPYAPQAQPTQSRPFKKTAIQKKACQKLQVVKSAERDVKSNKIFHILSKTERATFEGWLFLLNLCVNGFICLTGILYLVCVHNNIFA